MVQCSIADEMQLFTLIILLCSGTKYIVNCNGMSKIEMKSINATCKGKSCDGYDFKICYSKKGGVPTCLHVYDTFTTNNEPVELQKFDNVSKQFDGIGLTILPFTFVIYINDETIYDSTRRHQNGRTMVLTFQKDTGSFIQIELTSVCYDENYCTGFLCQDCFTKPPTVTVPHSKTGVIGENVTIPCNVSEVYSETVITWIKNNGNFDSIINIDDSDRFVGGTYNLPDLTIISSQKGDEGNYTCQAQNLEFNGSSQPVHLSIFEYPVVNVSNIDPVVEGTNITIPCYISPTSDVTQITWYKNNSTIDINGNDRFSGGTISSPSLEIYFVEEYDEGNYTCYATNPVGTSNSLPTHLTFLPDIPRVHISGIEAVNIGKNITISCTISSVSELTKVVWSKNNIEFNLNATRTKDDNRFSVGTLRDPSLTIYSVQITDEGNYSCNASNAAEETGWSKAVHLTVFEVTTESLLSTDQIFSTSELSTSTSDIASPDLIFSTTEVTDPFSDTMPSTKPSALSPSVKSTFETTSTHVSSTELTDPFSDTMPSTKPSALSPSVKSTIETTSTHVSSTELTDPFSDTMPSTKPSTVPPSVKSTIETTSTHVPSTKSRNSSSTVNTSTTTTSILSSTSKSTTSPSSSKPPNTVTYTVRSTKKIFATPSSSHLPTQTIGSKVNSENSENLNAWVITTTVICVVEFIVIVLVVYIMWLRKQRRLAMQYEKEETSF